MKKKIILVARDAAPSRCFEKIKPLLENQYEVKAFLGGGKPIVASIQEIQEYARKSDFTILGMSSSRELAEPEIAAGMAAKEAGIPYGFYGDVMNCWARARGGSWFAPLAEQTKFYFGINDSDTVNASIVFPAAELVATGNPLREEMAFPAFTREQVREKLQVAEEAKVVLAPGGKFTAGNIASWSIVMEALSQLARKDVLLVLSPHPGDRTCYAIDAETKKALGIYEELVRFSPVKTVISNEKTSNLVPGADLVVEFGSSIGIEAAYQGIPVITSSLEILWRRLEQVQGNRALESISDRISYVSGMEHMKDMIDRLLTDTDERKKLINRQQEVCPRPEMPGQALKKIVESVRDLLK